MDVDERFERLNWEMFERLMQKNPHFATLYELHEPTAGIDEPCGGQWQLSS